MQTALEAYAAAATNQNVDWRKIADQLFHELSRSRPRTSPKKPTIRDDGFVDIVYYKPKGKEKTVGPTMVVIFEDGTLARMTFATQTGKPLNVGRGLRHCVARYRQHVAYPELIDSQTYRDLSVPPIWSAHVERDGQIIGRVAPDEANAYTALIRAKMPNEDAC